MKTNPKTAHSFARELLQLPDYPIYHFDPSLGVSGDDNVLRALTIPSAVVETEIKEWGPIIGINGEFCEDAYIKR